jgi:hypothetical protein
MTTIRHASSCVVLRRVSHERGSSPAGDDHRALSAACVSCRLYEDVAEAKATNASDTGRRLGYPLLFTTGRRSKAPQGYRHQRRRTLGVWENRVVHPMTRNSSRSLRLMVSRQRVCAQQRRPPHMCWHCLPRCDDTQILIHRKTFPNAGASSASREGRGE